MSLTSSIRQSGSGMAALYRRYAEWLVSITWKRFILLSLLLLIVTGMLSNLPPFSWDLATRTTHVPASRNVDITVDDNGVRIKPKRKGSQAPEITIDEHGVRMRSNPQGPAHAPPTPATPPRRPGSKADEISEGPGKEAKQEPAEEESTLAEDIRREVIDAIAE